MGLEKLKSVFKEGFPGPVNGWPNTHDTGFKLKLGEGSKTQFILGDTLPVLDSIQRGSSYQFVSEDLTTKLYNSEFFDPRVGRPRGPIYNINTYEGTRFDDGVGGLFNQTQRYYGGFGNINTPKFEDIINSGNVTANSGGYPNLTGLLERYKNINPQNESRSKPEGYLKDGKINTNRTWTQSSIPQFNDLYSTAGGQEKRTITIDLANDLKAKTLEGISWETLYNPNHTAKEDVGYSYPNVSRDNLNIRYNQNPSIRSIAQKEPYVVSDIGSDKHKNSSREYPVNRIGTDMSRIDKYLDSDHGKQFFLNQNALGLVSSVTFRLTAPGSAGPMAGKDILISSPQRFGSLYRTKSTKLAVEAGLTGFPGYPARAMFERGFPFAHSSYPGPTWSPLYPGAPIEDTFRGGGLLGTRLLGYGAHVRNPLQKSGDKMTLASMIKGKKLGGIGKTIAVNDSGLPMDIPFDSVDIESKKNGMPFYFKDLRDDTYVIFRAYIEGLTENISPSWSSQNYIGRSEPVYVYERSERDVSFTLKLFAHSPDELDSIYQKINRLTSMCYPQYVQDKNLNNKLRMKPPLLKFRLGELFGSDNNEMLGFLKSCVYAYPDSSPWETEVGKRVPKHIMVSITYQVIHMEVPSLDFARKKDDGGNKNEHSFYGITSPQNTSGLANAGGVGQGV